ncbi:hypothetical protein DRQ15_09350 [candidate division KSB1 bacterium]|nr:MAG: hypothetical protein DRQ15_09350 [candidate division KSB1 bacterium]
MASMKVVAFGDSVTVGTSAKLDVFHDCFQYGTTTVNMVRETQTWWSILERILSDWVREDVRVIGSGMAGDTSSKGLARLRRDVLSQSPDYVLVMFGVEDVLRGTETEAFRKNLEKIVNGIAAQGARPVLMTPTPISERMTAAGCTLEELRRRQQRLSDLAQVVRKLAEEGSLGLIDLNRYFLENRLAYDHLFEGWLPDGVAQSGMASFVAGEILQILGIKNFPKPTLCDYRKIYSDAKHPDTKNNAATSLTFFGGRFYVGFDSGPRHAGPGHRGIVLKSVDGISWQKEAVLEISDVEDVGSPYLIEVDGRLFGYATTTVGFGTPPLRYMTYGFERLGPGRWSQPFKCAPCVFWHPRKWRNQYVVATYAWPEKEAAVKLLSSPDGRSWKVLSNILPYETGGTETDLFVQNDKLMAFSRAGKGSNDEMLISTYIPSENRWETVSSGRIIQAPYVFKAGERIMLSGRYCSQSDERFRELQKDWNKFNSGTATEVAQVDPARVEEFHHGLRTGIFVIEDTRPRLIMELLSAGDSSYTGVVQYGNEYVVSDYSMHEYYPEIKRPGDWNTPCDIYLSRIRFKG